MRRVEGKAPNCSPRNTRISPVIQDILADQNRTLACSEFTLIEFHSNVTSNWRSSEFPDCDESWWESSIAELLDYVADGRINVRPTPAKGIEQAMALVTVATKNHGRALRAWDALHFVVASAWAYEVGKPVEIVTSDRDFAVTLDLVGVTGMLSLLNLDMAGATGEGADRGNALG